MKGGQKAVLWAAGVMLILGLLGACVVGMGALAPRVLGAGPEGIDLRPTPGDSVPEAILPAEVAGYTRGKLHEVASFLGLDLGPDGVEAIYSASGRSARLIAARLASDDDAAAFVASLADLLEKAGVLGSCRLRSGEPYEGWWSSAGKRNFVYWHAPGWATDQYGFAWQSGHWCFVVTANDPVARRDVALDFPY